MHSRKSRTFRSYIRNARARVGKVAGTRDISNRYRSRCLFDSSFILFLFPFLSFLLFPPLSLSLSLSPQPRIINASSRVWHAREPWKLYRFPVSRRFESAEPLKIRRVYISASRNLWTNLGRGICPGSDFYWYIVERCAVTRVGGLNVI